MKQQPLLRVSYLSRVRQNPYVSLLAAGVQQAHPTVRSRQIRTLWWRHLLPRPNFDILHIHWAELQFSYGQPSPPQARRLWHGFMRKLRWIQARDRRIVYTVHNLAQHEGRFSQLNDATNRWLFKHAHAIHVHDSQTASALAERYDRRHNVFVIPHGHYIDAYPNTTTRAQARQHLELPDHAFVYLFLGQIRPYKGLDLLIDAFGRLQDDQSRLLIAGNVDVSDYGARIRQLAAQHPRIHLFPAFIGNEDLQTYFNACDIVVLPYRHATTSGAAMLAYSFARAIIAPALGPFPELVGSERGVLFQPGLSGLQQALLQAQQLDLAAAGQAAMAFAARHDWTSLGRRHYAMYRSALTA